MTRTPTLPLDDRSMWRRLLGRTHPDAGGDHELFIWTGAVRDHVCSRVSGRFENPAPTRRAPYEDPARVPFDPSADFSELTRRALEMAADGSAGPYGPLLELLADCKPPLMQTGAWALRGAPYKRLAAIGHTVGMSKAERGGWYRAAERIPLSDRHAGHILDRLKRMAT